LRCTNCTALRCRHHIVGTVWGGRAGGGVAIAQGGCGRAQPHTTTTTPPQSWPTHPPHLHHKPTRKVAGFVVKLWCQSLVAGPCSHGAGKVWEATTPRPHPSTHPPQSVAEVWRDRINRAGDGTVHEISAAWHLSMPIPRRECSRPRRF
jgi:hypothetical protein